MKQSKCKLLTRRQFTTGSLAAAVSIISSPAYASLFKGRRFIEALVIGSGFGGAVAALRLGEAGIETIVLERGRRWKITDAGDTFCTKENLDGRSTWLSNTTIVPPPNPNVSIDVFTGVLDRTVGNGATPYRGAGVGGLYQVSSNVINEQGVVLKQKSFICRYLFLAAGSIGTTELLLRAKANRTLRNLNDSVGLSWGTNGESTSFMAAGTATNPTLGTAGVVAVGHLDNPITPLVLEPFQGETGVPQGLAPTLGMGILKSEGVLTYNNSTQSADLYLPANSPDSLRYAQALQFTYQLLNEANGTSLVAPTDFVDTAHPIGGAVLDAVCNDYGEVFGQPNLFVVDGALIPGGTGSNPSFTIAALAERAMDRILDRPRRGNPPNLAASRTASQ